MPATVKLTRHLVGEQTRRGKFDVLVDGTGGASIDAHETIEPPVEPGHHPLPLRYGRYSSRTAAFDAAEGQVVAFRCGEKRFLPIFLASFVVPSLAIPLRACTSTSPTVAARAAVPGSGRLTRSSSCTRARSWRGIRTPRLATAPRSSAGPAAPPPTSRPASRPLPPPWICVPIYSTPPPPRPTP